MLIFGAAEEGPAFDSFFAFLAGLAGLSSGWWCMGVAEAEAGWQGICGHLNSAVAKAQGMRKKTIQRPPPQALRAKWSRG